MAHDIGQMFYYGERPWHALGTPLAEPANMDEALQAGGLDWTVKLVPLAPAGEPFSAVPHRRAVVRSDREPGQKGRVIGVVHPGFRPLQNRDAAKLFDSLLGRGQRVYHTGGYLRDGEVVWLLARLPRNIKLDDGKDVIEPYLLFSNSHDGSQAIDIRLTTVRVVCQNTLSLALGRESAKLFRRGHDGSFALLQAEATAFFAFVSAQCDEAARRFEKLRKARCEANAFERFLETLLPQPTRPRTADQNNSVLLAYETRLETVLRARRQVCEAFREGIPERKIAAEPKTWWGALNTVTAWVDHQQEIKNHRYAHILFGAGDTLKSRALKLATEGVR